MAERADAACNEILTLLSETGEPLGATQISRALKSRGMDLQPRSVRHYLGRLDAAGMTEQVSRRMGRRITVLGREEAARVNVVRKIGFVAARVDVLAYRMSYNLRQEKGTLVGNVAVIRKRDLSRAMHSIQPVFKAKLGMGTKLALVEDRATLGGVLHKPTEILIGTVCSVTANGILMREGIPVTSRFGGLLELRDGEPVRFVQLIEYRGTTVDPLEVFIQAGMTRVGEAARTGNGVVGVSFREIPSDAVAQVARIHAMMECQGLGGIVKIGDPNQPLFDVPVAEGRTGIIVMGGMNPFAALHEAGVPVTVHSLAALEDAAAFSAYNEWAYRGRRPAPYVD